MKITIYWYECPTCHVKRDHLMGGGSVTFGQDGEITSKSWNEKCPKCGGDFEHKSKIVDAFLYNQRERITRERL